MGKPHPKPPQWFMRRKYTRLLGLGLSGWSEELTRICELSIEHKLGLHVDDPRVEVHYVAGNPRVFLPGAPLVQLVSPTAKDRKIPPHLLPSLVVNISAPDEVISEQFRRGLIDARKQFPVPFNKKSGKQTKPNSLIGDDTFESWIKAKIVPFADLLAWRATLDQRDQKATTRILMCEWLFEDQDKVKIHAVEDKLKEAIRALPYIAAQLKYDVNPVRKTENEEEAKALLQTADLKLADEWSKRRRLARHKKLS